MMWDIITATADLDGVEARLRALDPVVDRVVVLHPKINLRALRWKPWKGKLSKAPILARALADIRPTDAVILSEAEDIPDPALIRTYARELSHLTWVSIRIETRICVILALASTIRNQGVQALRDRIRRPPIGPVTQKEAQTRWHPP